MPGRDGSGPMGQGALTGRGLGPCGTNRTVRGFGRGFGAGAVRGMRAGFGRGYRNYENTRAVPVVREPITNIQSEYTKEQELEDLKTEKETIERELKDVEQRIKELK